MPITTYKQLADNLRGTIDADLCDKIAAADELLAVAIRALEIIEGEYPVDDEIAGPVITELRAVIAKATP